MLVEFRPLLLVAADPLLESILRPLFTAPSEAPDATAGSSSWKDCTWPATLAAAEEDLLVPQPIASGGRWQPCTQCSLSLLLLRARGQDLI